MRKDNDDTQERKPKPRNLGMIDMPYKPKPTIASTMPASPISTKPMLSTKPRRRRRFSNA